MINITGKAQVMVAALALGTASPCADSGRVHGTDSFELLTVPSPVKVDFCPQQHYVTPEKNAQNPDLELLKYITATLLASRSQFAITQHLLTNFQPGDYVLTEGSDAVYDRESYTCAHPEIAQHIASEFPQGLPSTYEELTYPQKLVLGTFGAAPVLLLLDKIDRIHPAGVLAQDTELLERIEEIRARVTDREFERMLLEDPEVHYLVMTAREASVREHVKQLIADGSLKQGATAFLIYGGGHIFYDDFDGVCDFSQQSQCMSAMVQKFEEFPDSPSKGSLALFTYYSNFGSKVTSEDLRTALANEQKKAIEWFERCGQKLSLRYFGMLVSPELQMETLKKGLLDLEYEKTSLTYSSPLTEHSFDFSKVWITDPVSIKPEISSFPLEMNVLGGQYTAPK